MPTLYRNHSIATTVSDCSPAQYESFEAPYKSPPVRSVLSCLSPSTYSRILYLGQRRDTTGGYLLGGAKAPPESSVSILLMLFPVRLPASAFSALPHPRTRLRALCLEMQCSGVALRSLASLLLLPTIRGVVLHNPTSHHRLPSNFGALSATAWLRILLLLIQSFTTLDSSTMRWWGHFPMACQSLNLARSEVRLTFKITPRN